MGLDGSITATATAIETSPASGRPFLWLGASASMDITNILNRKGSAAAAAMAAAANPDQHLQRQLAHLPSPLSPSESGSERGPSSYGAASLYSNRTAHALHAMANVPTMAQIPTDLRYATATSMQPPLPMLPNDMMSSAGYDPAALGQEEPQDTARPSLGSPTQKAFPCASCGKGFARRSDLARHGTGLHGT